MVHLRNNQMYSMSVCYPGVYKHAASSPISQTHHRCTQGLTFTQPRPIHGPHQRCHGASGLRSPLPPPPAPPPQHTPTPPPAARPPLRPGTPQGTPLGTPQGTAEDEEPSGSGKRADKLKRMSKKFALKFLSVGGFVWEMKVKRNKRGVVCTNTMTRRCCCRSQYVVHMCIYHASQEYVDAAVLLSQPVCGAYVYHMYTYHASHQ